MNRHQLSPTHRANQTVRARVPYARVGAIFLLLAAFGLRLHRLGAESLWYDETVSVYLATQPVTELIAHTARDIHPPAYYLLLHIWRWIAMPSVAFGLEFLYGWASLFFGMIVLGLTHALGKRFFGPNAALWALALALFQPAQIWFSQEVRMYVLGAFCLLLSLWAVSPVLADSDAKSTSTTLPFRAAMVYLSASLIGLYTLYYFAFWLVTLNLCTVYRLWDKRGHLRDWLALQLLLLIGWLPWLPIFIRQAITPPVPGWRAPWQDAGEVAHGFVEAFAATWTAHIAPLGLIWPWAFVIVLIVSTFYVYAKDLSISHRLLWITLCFGPIALILTVTVVGVPIYHVRYVATYAPIFPLLIAALLRSVKRSAALPIFVTFATISAISVHQFWTDPLYRADDHRGAVASIAKEWRPGDAILVNAGWAYTAISVYWPTELPQPSATRPPALNTRIRLTPAAFAAPRTAPSSQAIPLYVTGSVDGSDTLGWGLTESDFFAISADDTVAALSQLASQYRRIWHYRLYDTVSDPHGHIRVWLHKNTSLFHSQPVPGRDYLLIEGFQTQVKPTSSSSPVDTIAFPQVALAITRYGLPSTLPAGEILYVTIGWDSAQDFNSSAPLTTSLRLYDPTGRQLLQDDSRLAIEQSSTTQTLALAIPADIIPGSYSVALVLYSPETLAAFEAIDLNGAPVPSPLQLGDVTVGLPKSIPHTPRPFATFDYIDLLQVELPQTEMSPGTTFDMAWTWRPRPNAYRDHYRATVRLHADRSSPLTLLEFDLGVEGYPSSKWPAAYPLRQITTLTLPSDLPPGLYPVSISLSRASDSTTIPARQGWSIERQPVVTVGEIVVAEP